MQVESKCLKFTVDALRLNNQNRCFVAVFSYNPKIVTVIQSEDRATQLRTDLYGILHPDREIVSIFGGSLCQ